MILMQAEEVDIVLILESSYPYVYGGVSTWVHQIIENFPQYRFALVFLGGTPEQYKEGIRYQIPENVISFQVHYLYQDAEPTAALTLKKDSKGAYDAIKEMHDSFKCPRENPIRDISALLSSDRGLDYEQFLFGKTSWEYITEEYSKQCEDIPFIDYFWTIKNIHKPLWKLASILKQLPKTRLVHTISTGYAGLLSFFIKEHFNYPVILTEHGIYTRERKVEIFLNQVFRDDPDKLLTEPSYLQALWDRYFKTLSLLTYRAADPIISLFSHAHEVQLEEGADVEKTLVIPNGINLARFKPLRRLYNEKQNVICMMGRVVPIKDVKGFIRAIAKVHKQIPDLKVWIIGSTSEEPEYARECVELVENILLNEVIEFKPHQPVEDIFPPIKLLIMSSIRESMPFVILESFAAGVPVISTDVGACKEMILGSNEEDIGLGAAGRVVKIADDKVLAQAICDILDKPDLWYQMSISAMARVERFYDEKMMIQKYEEIYKHTMMV